MMTVEIAGGASTQSRARRPLPGWAKSATTISGYGAYEDIIFTTIENSQTLQRCLSWVGGQSGLLWGHGPIPFECNELILSGAYGHQAEYDLASALGLVYDGLLTSSDMSVRFFQNGGDACSAAARVCRAVTGRNQILSYGYHGAHLDYAHAPALGGIPSQAQALHINFQDWRSFRSDTTIAGYYRYAAVVLEVPPAEDDEIREWLQSWREYCDRTETPLVIDDVVLGFRIALGGSAEYYGVKPDIVILGKAMSATGCVSAVLGRKDLVGRLADDVFYSCTFAGAPGPCAVAAATVNWLRENRAEVYGNLGIGYLRRIGQALKDGLNGVGVKVIGQPERSVAVFNNEEARRAWCRRMIEQGVICDRPFFSTLVHTMDDVTKTIEAAKAIS